MMRVLYIVKKYNTGAQIKENKLIVETEYFEVYCDYKEIIKKIKNFFINKDKDNLYNELKKNKKQFTEIKKLIDKFITKINNSSDKRMILTLPNDYKMIFYNFDNVERWINIFQNIKIKEENINIIEELFIKEEVLLLELTEVILKNKNEIIEKLEKNINEIIEELKKNNLKLEKDYEDYKIKLKEELETNNLKLKNDYENENKKLEQINEDYKKDYENENKKLEQIKKDYEYDKKNLKEKYIKDEIKLKKNYEYKYNNHKNKYEYDKNELKIYFNIELLKIIKLDDLEYKITNIIKIINYLDLECEKQNSCDNKHILELLNKLLDIFVKEQQLKLKDIINEINEHKQELMKIPYIFNAPEIYNETQKINYIIFNIEIRKNIDIVINIINNIFYYNYENIFKQILIKDDFLIKKLFSNLDDIYILSELENNLKKLKDNINFLSESENNISKYYKLYVENIESNKNIKIIQEKQNIILKLIFNIKLIMINMKEKCLNKILKYKFDIIKNTLDEIDKSNIYFYNLSLKINKIEQYFVFQINNKLEYIKLDKNKIITLIEQLSLNKQLKELSRYFTEKNILKFDKFNKIFQIVQEMITIENDYNNENMILIHLLDNFKAEQLWNIYSDIIKNFNNNNINELYDLIIKFYNDDKINNFPIEFKSFHFNSNIIKNIEQIIIYLNDNVDDKNFINIIKIYYIISKSVKYEIYRNRELINYKIANDSLLNKFNNICNLLKNFFYIFITYNFYLVKKNIEIIKKDIIREIIEKRNNLTYENIVIYEKIMNENIKNINNILLHKEENVENLTIILDNIKNIEKIALPCNFEFFKTEENRIYCNLKENLKDRLKNLIGELTPIINNF